MPFPEGLPTVLVTYTAANPAGGGPAQGTAEFAPVAPAVSIPEYGIVFSGATTYRFDDQGRLVDHDGHIGVRLLPCDIPGANPTSWVWMVTINMVGAGPRRFYVFLSQTQTEVDLGRIEQVEPSRSHYVAVPGPRGPQGVPGPPGPTRDAWRRRDLPKPTAADAPPVTVTLADTAQPGTVLHAPEGVLLEEGATAGRYTYAGAAAMTPGADGRFVRPASLTPGTYDDAQPAWAVEFGTDASSLQVLLQQQPDAAYRISIDCRRCTTGLQPLPAAAPGANQLLTMDLGAPGPRRIRIDLRGTAFGGLRLPVDASLWRVPLYGGRLMVLGDALTTGHGDTWIDHAAQLLGATDVWRQARPGSGYTAAGTYGPFADRLKADVIGWAPDRLIIWGGHHDTDAPAVEAAAATLLRTVRTALPSTDVLVLGAWDPTGEAGEALVARDTALRAAAASAGVPYVSPLTGSGYDATGLRGIEQGPWTTTATTATVATTEGLLTPRGHEYLGRRVVDAWVELASW
ncbi:hypothetical protein [Streptomyces sp. NPDC056069]|uniref:hypothetical protein n=1 Tax=Streptomyces sp. NPDC056069 TaxID=3345702 RepID=UPI0035DA97AC